MRENIFTHKSVATAAENCQTAMGTGIAMRTEMAMSMEASMQPATQSVEQNSNQNTALNGSAVAASAISGGGG